jgi:hypothetical protein
MTNGSDKKKVIARGHVHCPRVERPLSVEEHLACPYCYGGEQEVREGGRECFCDFDKAKDPVHFGFPEDQGRYRG